jgi:hypothetical protein
LAKNMAAQRRQTATRRLEFTAHSRARYAQKSARLMASTVAAT